jgi:hypothetical protein
MAEKLNKDAVYKSAKPQSIDVTINDGGGLSLLVKTNGVKRWVFIYRFEGKQNRLGFGTYPASTLEHARRKAEAAREQLANGINPSEVKKESKAVKRVTKENEKRLADGLPIEGSFADITMQWLSSIEHLTNQALILEDC